MMEPIMPRPVRVFLLAVILFMPPAASVAQEAEGPPPPLVALSDDLLSRVPPAYREQVRLFVKARPETQAYLAKVSDDELAAWGVRSLGWTPEAGDFLVAQ